MEKAIVTGANGFIGSNLVKCLISHGVRVTAIVRNEKSDIASLAELKNVEIIYCPLSEISSLPDKISGKKFDAFYHLAWEGNSGVNRQNHAMQMQNAIYAADALKASESLGCEKILFSGTITEKIAANILNLTNITAQNMIYGIAKNAAHQVCEFLSRTSRVKFMWCVLSNIYGPGNKTGNIISYALQNLMNGKIPEFSSAGQPFDLMHAEDCVEALYSLGNCATNMKEFFIGSGSPGPLKDYLLQTGRAAGFDISSAIGKRPDDGLQYDLKWFETADLTKETGFTPKISFEDGIRNTIESMKKEKKNF
jgi:nucleoside-diphosphate-sugar epimerase